MDYIIRVIEETATGPKNKEIKVTSDFERAMLHIRSYLMLGYDVKVEQHDTAN